MSRNPFGDETPPPGRPANPFGDDAPTTQSPAEAAARIEYAAMRIRGLRMKMGAEGLTLTAQRELIDEVAAALESAARALRALDRE